MPFQPPARGVGGVGARRARQSISGVWPEANTFMLQENTLRSSSNVLASMIDLGTTVNKNRFCIVLPTPTRLFHDTM
eukprot:8544372-Pyramimonas_sp.AAC.1